MPDSAVDEAPGRKRTIRKRRRNLLLVKIRGAWVLLLGGVVFIAWMIGTNEPAQTRKAPTAIAGDDVESAFLKKAQVRYSQSFGGFLSASSPEERDQFVRNPVGTAGIMARYYDMNPIGIIEPSKVSLNGNQILKLNSESVIGTSWKVADGRTVDAVFFEKDGDWLLDWQQYVRYSDMPWALFLAGTEDQSAEFRLLARQRLARENAAGDHLSLVFYAPRFGAPSEIGTPSPEFIVPRNSENGRLLGAAFQMLAENKRPYDAQLSRDDPDGMIRVRVRVRRIQDDHGRHFELEKVIACHWISVDEPGVVPLTEQQVSEQKNAARVANQAPKPAE